MPSNAVPAWGTTIAVSDGGTPAIFTDVGEVVSMTPSITRDTIEKTHLKSPGMAKEFLATLISAELTLECNYIPGDTVQDAIYDDIIETTPANVTQTYRILWPTIGDVTVGFTGSDVDTGGEKLDLTAHDIKTPQQIRFTTDGTLPDPLVVGTIYWAGALNANAVTIYTTKSDAVADTNRVDLADGGTGNHTMHYQAELLFSAIPRDFEPSHAADGKADLSITMQLTGSISSTV